MRQGPLSAAKILLETVPLDSRPAAVIDLITQIVVDQKWVTDHSVAREKAEQWQREILNYLRNNQNALLEIGIPCRIAFNSSSEYMIQGACFIEPRDTEETRQSKLRRLRSEQYYQLLLGITPEQFEILCGKLIGLIGVQDPVVTRRSADEGIDFYGHLSFDSLFFPQDLTPTIQKQLCIWIVGQAKRNISTQSGTAEIRDLVGAVSLGRAHTFGSVHQPYSDLKIRLSDPVFVLLITTSSISANAWNLIKRSGVIGMDGEMVAAFLADREAGLGPEGLSREAFLEWLGTG